jgi:hypothetical protein
MKSWERRLERRILQGRAQLERRILQGRAQLERRISQEGHGFSRAIKLSSPCGFSRCGTAFPSILQARTF